MSDLDTTNGDIVQALDFLGAGQIRWNAPAKGGYWEDRVWSLAVPGLDLGVEMTRRPSGERGQESGGVTVLLRPGFLVAIRDAEGRHVPMEGRYRQTLLGEMDVAQAKTRAVAVVTREVGRMRDASELARELAREAPRHPVLERALLMMGDPGWPEMLQPIRERWFKAIARMELVSRSDLVLPLAEAFVAADAEKEEMYRAYHAEDEAWRKSATTSYQRIGERTVDIVRSQSFYPGDDPVTFTVGSRTEPVYDGGTTRYGRPSPSDVPLQRARAALETARTALVEALDPIARDVRSRALVASNAAAALEQARTARDSARHARLLESARAKLTPEELVAVSSAGAGYGQGASCP